MPEIYDNIKQYLSKALNSTLSISNRADFCVGYFNLRGWGEVDSQIGKLSGGEAECCRLLVGMPISPDEELQKAFNPKEKDRIDQGEANRLKKRLAEKFRNQLCYGLPNDADERGLRKLLSQLKNNKLTVKLYTRHSLHAKLYLVFREDPVTPIIGYLGSSNLTFSGLVKQGELNVDVLEQDAAKKLAEWFEERWEDNFCIDITQDLIEIIEESWAREDKIPPYHIYLKIAYTLSQEARTGIAEEVLPEQFEEDLLPFQKEAVKIAAHHLKKRGGVLVGDVVGLGKTITATAIASLFEYRWRILVICPKNLVSMWKDYAHKYRVQMQVVSITQAHKLPEMRRYQLVIIDESHNLRNREGKRYKFVKEYISQNDSKVILLSATPYNKTYLDLGSQLRLFIDENDDIGIAPEFLIRDQGELFLHQHECRPRTLRAFEYSEYTDDWRELMRLFLVRRTRSFIKDNYAKINSENEKKYLLFSDGRRSYFPARNPKTLKFDIDDQNPEDLFAQLYSEEVVEPISKLQLPRYGLGNYIKPSKSEPPTSSEEEIIKNLSRAGKRLMGFCRTGLFKRLESSGSSFIQSIERHILRNYVYIHALKNGLEIPIGSQDVEMLDTRNSDQDEDSEFTLENSLTQNLRDISSFEEKAGEVYSYYIEHAKNRFKWIDSRHFIRDLENNLENDAKILLTILKKYGDWQSDKDKKLKKLQELITEKHPEEKIIIFTQFADTADYLIENLERQGIKHIEAVTGDNENPTALAHRFSPQSNNKKIPSEKELRVLVSTDVLSEGQNLQDCHIIVNYDLPWAIIRLIQRVGRVDRIGQKHDQILCYSFMPAEGVEKLIRLRARVQNRLKENAEVLGSDEAFFENQEKAENLKNLYNENADILDEDTDGEVDLSSEAYQIWKNAIDNDPELEDIISSLPNVVYSTMPWNPSKDRPEGVLVFVKTGQDTCGLAWLDKNGESVTESQYLILKSAKCKKDTPAINKHKNHHELVGKGVELMLSENRSTIGGTLGSKRGVRYRIYEVIKLYLEEVKESLFDTQEIRKAIQQIFENTLTEKAKTILSLHLKKHSAPATVAEVVRALYEENELCHEPHSSDKNNVKLICSLGLKNSTD